MTSKTCFKCHQDKQLSDFYAHPAMADGHLNKCKVCARKDSCEHRSSNLDSVRAYDRERSKHPDRLKAMTAQAKKWRQEDRRRMAAHNAVTRAVRKGDLVRSPCERCGRADSLGHHENYDRKLDVIWLCQPCHKKRHQEMVITGLEP